VGRPFQNFAREPSGRNTWKNPEHPTAQDEKDLSTTQPRLRSGWKHYHLDQGVAVTSHASQGKTVDQVIVSAPVESFSQVNQSQFYVSMSRAREAMHVFTNSKAALRQAVCRSGARKAVSEFLKDFCRPPITQSPSLRRHREPELEMVMER
jgi:hypothetical protein